MTDRKFWVGLILFMILGGALGAMGISISENPYSFLTIMSIAVLIDINASTS